MPRQLLSSIQKPGWEKMPIQLTPTRIKGSKYLLIPKDLAQLLEIDDQSVLNLTIEESNKDQRLVYSIRGKNGISNKDAGPQPHSDKSEASVLNGAENRLS